MILKKEFIEPYKTKTPPFGFNGLGEITYKRTYSREIEGQYEEWYQTIKRVVEGQFSILENHLRKNRIPFKRSDLIEQAEATYEFYFSMKALPPGRGLWAMGTDFVHKRNVPEALQNCAFNSTETIDKELGSNLEWFMNKLMVGVGVGFDTKGRDKLKIRKNRHPNTIKTVVIEDSREAWAESVKTLFDSFFVGEKEVRFDYSKIREAGEPIKGFGGKASGPAPLKELHKNIKRRLNRKAGKLLSSTDLVDIFNWIGKCVVAGNVRRSAELAYGEYTEEFMDLKNYEVNPHRAEWGWLSNNSVEIKLDSDLKPLFSRIEKGIDIGLIIPENFNLGRSDEQLEDNAVGFNPCAEQPLAHRELCTLFEVFLPMLNSREEFFQALSIGYNYAKTVTLLSDKISDKTSRHIMLKNRRIGISLTGITQYLEKHPDKEEFKTLLDEGYRFLKELDKKHSEYLQVNPSIRITTVKPSGTISLLMGVTPGVHFAPGGYYSLRGINIPAGELVDALIEAGYKVEESVYTKGSYFAQFPITYETKTELDASLEEQFELVYLLQKYWSDNGVSVTFKYTEQEKEQFDRLITKYKYVLKAMSFLELESSFYEQMPYQTITEEEYIEYKKSLKPIQFKMNEGDKVHELYCTGDKCILQWN